MAESEQLKILIQGAKTWNAWRRGHPYITPDLTDAVLIGGELAEAELHRANFAGANLTNSTLKGAQLYRANLSGANLKNTNLTGANLSSANLNGTNFSRAVLGWTIFADNDLSGALGLEFSLHEGPSTIGLDTLYRSGGNIPPSFLRNCGVPDSFIDYVPALIGAQPAIQFYSTFISYSHKDEEFATRLYARMRDAHLRVWFAPEDIKGGEKIHEQIDRAIQVHDRLLIILSEHSLQSQWVITEIRKARKVELKEKRRKLFPIRLLNIETIKDWECFDADSGKDLAVELREYFIPDFSNWKSHDSFEATFDRLLKDLRTVEDTP